MTTMYRPFSLGPWLLHRLPRNRFAAQLSRAYLSWFRSDNNVWADSNGEFDLVRIVAPCCRTVLDVGANVGDWTREMLRHNPELVVHCFEAAPDNFAQLSTSDLAGRITARQLAVSDHDGEITLFLEGDNSPLNSTVAPHAATGRSLTLEAITLDRYIEQQSIGHVDFLKVDVEGAEMPVIAGTLASLKAGLVDVVQFEHGPFSVYARTFIRDFFELFAALDFEMFKISSPKLLRYDHYDLALDNFSHQNWVAARRGTAVARAIGDHAVAGVAL